MINSYSRNKEWLRRRQIRIDQVRRQSNDIAKWLRERISNEEYQKTIQSERERELKLRLWKLQRLNDLQQKYSNAILDVGEGHKMAVEKSNETEIIMEKQKEMLSKAKERGITALDQERKRKKEKIEKKMLPIQRKLMTRMIEDLRSSLVLSLSTNQSSNIVEFENGPIEKPLELQLFLSDSEKETSSNTGYKIQKGKQKKKAKIVKSLSESVVNECKMKKRNDDYREKSSKELIHKTEMSSDLKKKQLLEHNNPEIVKHNFWVNLDDIEVLNKNEEKKKGKKKLSRKKKQKERKDEESGKYELKREKELEKKPLRQNKSECCSYSVGQYCICKNDVNLVKRMDNLQPNANELASKEEQNIFLNQYYKKNKEKMAEERGNKAFEKEKVIRNYNELLAKLDKLTTREKFIKSYCQIHPPEIFMCDERRREKLIKKQKIMDSEFEKIYYDVMGLNPDPNLYTQLNLEPFPAEINDCGEPNNSITKLDFGQYKSNLKTTTPASSFVDSETEENEDLQCSESPQEKIFIKKTASHIHYKRTKIIKKEDRRHLSRLDKVLENGRKLREHCHRKHSQPELNRGTETYEENLENVEAVKLQYQKCDSVNDIRVGTNVSDLCNSIMSSSGESISPSLSKQVKEASDLENRTKFSPYENVKSDMYDATQLKTNFSGVRTNAILMPVNEIKRKINSDGPCSITSSSSYRSLPLDIYPKPVNSLLRLLELLKKREGSDTEIDELIVKLEIILNCMIEEIEKRNLKCKEKTSNHFRINPQLNYYIKKLLDMSRERIANLSVSSESEKSASQIPHSCRFIQNENSVNEADDSNGLSLEKNYLKNNEKCERLSQLTRALELERIIKKWKRILDEICTDGNPNSDERYDFICNSWPNCKTSRKTDVPHQLHHNNICAGCENESENLTAHGIGTRMRKCYNEYCVCDGPAQKKNRDRFGSQTQENIGIDKNDWCDDFTCPFLQGELNENICNDKHTDCCISKDCSLESYPDVMEELLKKGILTSPFHWPEKRKLEDFNEDEYSNEIMDETNYMKLPLQIGQSSSQAGVGCQNMKVNETCQCRGGCKNIKETSYVKYPEEIYEQKLSKKSGCSTFAEYNIAPSFPRKEEITQEIILSECEHRSPKANVSRATTEKSLCNNSCRAIGAGHSVVPNFLKQNRRKC